MREVYPGSRKIECSEEELNILVAATGTKVQIKTVELASREPERQMAHVGYITVGDEYEFFQHVSTTHCG
jgi:hypothetical protein